MTRRSHVKSFPATRGLAGLSLSRDRSGAGSLARRTTRAASLSRFGSRWGLVAAGPVPNAYLLSSRARAHTRGRGRTLEAVGALPQLLAEKDGAKHREFLPRPLEQDVQERFTVIGVERHRFLASPAALDLRGGGMQVDLAEQGSELENQVDGHGDACQHHLIDRPGVGGLVRTEIERRIQVYSSLFPARRLCKRAASAVVATTLALAVRRDPQPFAAQRPDSLSGERTLRRHRYRNGGAQHPANVSRRGKGQMPPTSARQNSAATTATRHAGR